MIMALGPSSALQTPHSGQMASVADDYSNGRYPLLHTHRNRKQTSGHKLRSIMGYSWKFGMRKKWKFLKSGVALSDDLPGTFNSLPRGNPAATRHENARVANDVWVPQIDPSRYFSEDYCDEVLNYPE